MKMRFFATVLAGLAVIFPQIVSAQAAADDWSYSVMPYLWLPTVNATLNFNDKSVETKPDSYLDNLDFAGMLAGAARKGRWVIGSDLMYMHFSDSQSKVRAGGLLVQTQRIDEARDENHRDAGALSAQFEDQLDAIHAGHAEVSHHQVILSGAEQLHRLTRVAGAFGGIAQLLQHGAPRHQTSMIVIHEENPRHRGNRYFFTTDHSRAIEKLAELKHACQRLRIALIREEIDFLTSLSRCGCWRSYSTSRGPW